MRISIKRPYQHLGLAGVFHEIDREYHTLAEAFYEANFLRAYQIQKKRPAPAEEEALG